MDPTIPDHPADSEALFSRNQAECYFKFRFLPNSGYAFAVSPESYHSAPNSRTQHWVDRDRHTVMFNWY